MESQDKSDVELSAVVPLYNEEESVDELIKRLILAFESIGRSFELILVDDGSSDRTAEKLRAAQSADTRIRPVFLARNYGQSTAMQAGFDNSRAEIVVSLDGDLQNDPADIGRMLDILETEQADMVSGWRKDRQDDFKRVWISKIANKLISRVTKVSLHDYGCSLKVYRASLLRHVRIYGELHRFLPAVMFEVGAKIVETPVAHHPRQFGKSKYGFDRTIRVMLDLILIHFLYRYKHRPLHFFGGLGFASLMPGSLITAYLVFLKLFTGASIGSRPLMLAGVFMVLTGLVFIGLGLLGELIIRVLHEPSGRAQYLTKKSYLDQ